MEAPMVDELKIERQGLFNVYVIQKIKHDFNSTKKELALKLCYLLMFQMRVKNRWISNYYAFT